MYQGGQSLLVLGVVHATIIAVLGASGPHELSSSLR